MNSVVYISISAIVVVYKIPYRRARVAECARERRYLAYNYRCCGFEEQHGLELVDYVYPSVLYARFLCSRAHSAYAAARPSARATIGYLVCNRRSRTEEPQISNLADADLASYPLSAIAQAHPRISSR